MQYVIESDSCNIIDVIGLFYDIDCVIYIQDNIILLKFLDICFILKILINKLL